MRVADERLKGRAARGHVSLIGAAADRQPMEDIRPATSAEIAENWRLEQLLRVGYERLDAMEIAARRDVDLHQALELVEAGCSPDVAARILL